MGLSRECDITPARSARVQRLRAAVASGEYAPEPTDVAESVLAWTAPPTLFDRSVKKFSDPADSKGQTAKDHHSRR